MHMNAEYQRAYTTYPFPATEANASPQAALLSALDAFTHACDHFAPATASDATAAALVEASFCHLDAAATRALAPESQLGELEKKRLAATLRDRFLPYLAQTEVVRRMYEKPCGYAGDFFTIELIYRNAQRVGGGLGEVIDGCFLRTAPGQAVRNRRELLCDELGRSALLRPDAPLRVASLGSGPARELLDFVALRGSSAVEATLLDIDADALHFVREQALLHGFHPATRRTNLIRVAKGTEQCGLPEQDLIYSVGLIDYLADDLVVLLLNWIHGHLHSGGRVILGNFHPCNPLRVLMEEVMDWRLIHRTGADMDRLFCASRFGRAATEIRFEPAGVNLFASCTRA